MMTTSTHPLAADYLRRLERAAGALPRAQRDELVAEIRSHLDAGITPGASEADVRNLLDDLGTPEAIVAAAQPDRVGPKVERGPREVFALLMLVTGLPLLFLGWFAGAVLLLWSPLWTVRQKVLGLLVFPGGYVITLSSLLLIGARTSSTGETCTGSDDGSGVVTCVSDPSAITWNDTVLPTLLIIIAFVAPLIVAGYLYRAAGRRAAAS